MNLQVTN